MVEAGNATSGEGAATSFGDSPNVGVFNVGGRNTAATSTLDRNRFRSRGAPGVSAVSSSAGVNRQPRTAETTPASNGGVARSSRTSDTLPVSETMASTKTSPPPIAAIGMSGSTGVCNLAGVREIVTALASSVTPRRKALTCPSYQPLTDDQRDRDQADGGAYPLQTADRLMQQPSRQNHRGNRVERREHGGDVEAQVGS